MKPVRSIVLVPALAGAIALAGAAPSPSPNPTVTVHRVALQRPANMIAAAVVRSTVLTLPDGADGLRRIDMATGRDLPSPDLGTLGFSPVAMGVGTDRSLWLAGGSSASALWSPRDGLVFHVRGVRPQGNLVVVPGRAVAVGWASARACGIEAELFELGTDGTCTPLVAWPQSADVGYRRLVFSWITAGGLAPTPDGGFLLLDPVRGIVLRYDRRSRLSGSWPLANPEWHPPDLDAIPQEADATNRGPFFRWYRAQAVASRPAVLEDGTVAVVVGTPAPGGRVEWTLDLYRMDGTPRALGLALPGIGEHRVIVADADGGRLVLVAQAQDWPMGSPTSVVEVELRWGGEESGP